ncbi:sporulation protein YunB [Paenibacillus sp. FSL H7-0716]|uniref:Sporulation protein YunB n=1 Tax=Paenibacillus odorifer TaxID=189426 RepID=A0AAD0KM09_9BACL|nr:sporulation protein YunB [Paenibacillus odorifer]AWV35705.1 sporulation protein YunB [Paenibacillus odorifer]
MGRLKKWGNRRLRIPDLGHFRLPKINGDTNRRFSARSSAFKSKPSRAAVRPQRTRFEAKRSKGRFRLSSRPESKVTVAGGRTHKPRSRRKFWLIASLVILVLVLQSLRYVELHMKPPILHLAQIRVKQIATESINKAITSQVANGGNAEELIDWKTDKNGKISGFMLNYAEHMRITSQAAQVIQSTLQELHNRTEYIPLGQALGSPLIASYGPDIPIKIEPQGAVKVELSTRQQNAGINMILVEVYIHIVTEVAVVIPFDMEPQVVDTEIPVSYLMVVGDVPMYYYDNQGQPVGANGSSAPGIAIPAPAVGGDKSGVVDQSKDSSSNSQKDNSSSPAATDPASTGADHTEEDKGAGGGN